RKPQYTTSKYNYQNQLSQLFTRAARFEICPARSSSGLQNAPQGEYRLQRDNRDKEISGNLLARRLHKCVAGAIRKRLAGKLLPNKEQFLKLLKQTNPSRVKAGESHAL